MGSILSKIYPPLAILLQKLHISVLGLFFQFYTSCSKVFTHWFSKMDSEYLNTVWILISELFTKQCIYKVLMSKCGEEKQTNGPRKEKEKESTYFFSVWMLWFKIQLQSCRLSLLPPMHSSDSDQRAHTWKARVNVWVLNSGYINKLFQDNAILILFNTWLAFPENRTGSWGRNLNTPHKSSSTTHRFQTVAGPPTR